MFGDNSDYLKKLIVSHSPCFSFKYKTTYFYYFVLMKCDEQNHGC